MSKRGEKEKQTEPATFGARARRYRNDLGLNQEELVKALAKYGAEISQPYWSMCETSDRIPNGAVVAAVAKVLRVSADYLLGLTDDQTPAIDRTPVSITEETDQIALMVDELSAEQRRQIVHIVSTLARHPGALTEVSDLIESLASMPAHQFKTLSAFIHALQAQNGEA